MCSSMVSAGVHSYMRSWMNSGIYDLIVIGGGINGAGIARGHPHEAGPGIVGDVVHGDALVAAAREGHGANGIARRRRHRRGSEEKGEEKKDR